MASRIVLALGLIGAGCGGDPKATPEGTPTRPNGVSNGASGEAGGTSRSAATEGEFRGIRYTMPAGTNVANSGVDRPSHYPDPTTGDVVEIPTRIEPAISLTGGAKDSFFMVEIKMPPERTTLEGTISGMSAIKEASQFAGKPAPNGWTLTYEWRVADGPSVTMHHRHFVFPDSDYDCVYDDDNTKDVATAQAICDSIQSKPR